MVDKMKGNKILTKPSSELQDLLFSLKLPEHHYVVLTKLQNLYVA
jgi:hypothetical protein